MAPAATPRFRAAGSGDVASAPGSVGPAQRDGAQWCIDHVLRPSAALRGGDGANVGETAGASDEVAPRSGDRARTNAVTVIGTALAPTAEWSLRNWVSGRSVACVRATGGSRGSIASLREQETEFDITARLVDGARCAGEGRGYHHHS